MCVTCTEKLEVLFWLVNFINLFHKFILLFLLICPMERQQSCMLSVNKTCLLNGDLQIVSIFSLRLVPIMSYVDNFYIKECVGKGLGFFFLIPLYIFQIYGVFMNKILQGFIRVIFSLFLFLKTFLWVISQSERSIHQKKKSVKVVPTN